MRQQRPGPGFGGRCVVGAYGQLGDDAVSEAGTTPTLDGERTLWRGVFDPPGCTDLVLLARRVVAVTERRVVALPDHTPTVFGWGTRAHRLIVSGTAARIGTTRRSGVALPRPRPGAQPGRRREWPPAQREPGPERHRHRRRPRHRECQLRAATGGQPPRQDARRRAGAVEREE